jgi:hypothetical protein
MHGLVDKVTVFRDPANAKGWMVEISGLLNALLGEATYPNGVRALGVKVVAKDRYRHTPTPKPFGSNYVLLGHDQTEGQGPRPERQRRGDHDEVRSLVQDHRLQRREAEQANQERQPELGAAKADEAPSVPMTAAPANAAGMLWWMVGRSGSDLIRHHHESSSRPQFR